MYAVQYLEYVLRMLQRYCTTGTDTLLVQRGVHCECALHSAIGGHHPETVLAVLLTLNNFHLIMGHCPVLLDVVGCLVL